MKLSPALATLMLGQGCVAAFTTSPSSYDHRHSKDYTNLTVALVRAAPANWPEPFWNKNWTGVKFDLAGTVAKGLEYIEKAAANGADLVVFPELWFPGYPKGIDNAFIAEHFQDYYDNSLAVGSSEWQSLLAAAKKDAVYVALGFSHKTNQTMYMGQALISPEGEVLHLRHKLRPSGIERDFWSDGTMDEITVQVTPYGRFGLLECWEHFHPSMSFTLQAQLEDVHVAAFPYMPDADDSNALYWEALEVNGAAARLYAVNSGAYTLMTAVGHATVFDSTGLVIAEMSASTDMKAHPMLYASIKTTTFRNTSYDVNGEQSWGILKQIVNGFPSDIPKVNGTFVEQKTVLIADLLAYSKEYATNSSATPP